jgi:hypothetical protein
MVAFYYYMIEPQQIQKNYKNYEADLDILTRSINRARSVEQIKYCINSINVFKRRYKGYYSLDVDCKNLTKKSEIKRLKLKNLAKKD